MAPRKSHHKSRHGCLQCKQRRVKCNEGRPRCQNCVRRNVQCSLESSVNVCAGIATVASSQPDTGTTPAQHSAIRLPDYGHDVCRATRRSELHLMHHYSTVTCETMGNTPQQRQVWRMEVPREAVKHDFLMDGILSLAACHCAHLNPSTGGVHMTAAMQYQNSGLQGFRRALGHVSKDNYEAIFAFSVILTVLGFAMPPVYLESQPVSPARSLSCIFALLKGVKLTTDAYSDLIRNGMFRPLFRDPEDSTCRLSTVPSGDMDAAMARLRHRTHFMAKYVGAGVHQVYLSSIDSLEAAFREFNTTQTSNIIIAWPVMVGSGMVDLFDQGDPLALLIWAHYAVLTLSLHDQWWGRGFGLRLIEDLSSTLHDIDPEWDSWTEWARIRASLITA